MNICPQEQGSQGEPLFLEVSTTLKAMSKPNIVCIGGRYGLGSKEFTPNMVLSVYENLKKAMSFGKHSGKVEQFLADLLDFRTGNDGEREFA